VTLFGMLVVLAFCGWLTAMAHAYFGNPSARTDSSPARALFTLVGVVFVGMFLVGIFIPDIGTLTLRIGQQRFQLWAIGLVGMFVWLVLGWPLIKRL
jgi:hypothetical protein